MFFCSNIDEVVLNYVASVLESLGEEDSSFDVDQFIDMISAYVPGFSDISRSTSVVWKYLQCKIYILYPQLEKLLQNSIHVYKINIEYVIKFYSRTYRTRTL